MTNLEPAKDGSERPAIRKADRAAWVYDPPKRPGLSALLRGREARKSFARYWIKENLGNGADIGMHFALQALPVDVVSSLGASLGRVALTRFHKVAQQRARANIARLRPELGVEDREKLYIANCENQGRVMTEFSVIPRIVASPDRFVVHDARNMVNAHERGPIIIVGMHLGNWEIAPAIMRAHGIPVHANYVPPKERGRAWIAERVRTRGGLKFLPPGLLGMKDTYAVLRRGGAVSIFCDEGFQGRLRAPFFGRPVDADCNMIFAVKLARATGARLCPWYNIRRENAHFECFALPPVELAPQPTKRDALAPDAVLEDLKRLRAVVEPTVLRHLDQWYFLDNLLEY